MDSLPQASFVALLGALPGCPHPEAERPLVEPVAMTTAAAPTPPEAGPEATPDAGPEIPADVLAAKEILLRFRDHDAAALARARATIDAFEPPQRYEERGEVDGRPYYYAREVYPSLGLTLHHDGERITNVEPLR